MAEKKKVLYIVEAMGGGVFTYIVDFQAVPQRSRERAAPLSERRILVRMLT